MTTTWHSCVTVCAAVRFNCAWCQLDNSFCWCIRFCTSGHMHQVLHLRPHASTSKQASDFSVHPCTRDVHATTLTVHTIMMVPRYHRLPAIPLLLRGLRMTAKCSILQLGQPVAESQRRKVQMQPADVNFRVGHSSSFFLAQMGQQMTMQPQVG